MRTTLIGTTALAAALVLAAPALGSTAPAQAAGTWTASTATGVSGPVSAFSDGDAWALGNPGFAHWNGTTWQQVPAPADRGIVLAIGDGGPSNAWAVGKVTSGYHVSSPQIERWNGTSWAASPSPAISGRNAALSGVATVSASNAWAVGTDGSQSLVEHWDGTAWTRVSVPSPTTMRTKLSAVTARSATDVWAVGTFANTAPAPDSLYALHYDGTAWRVVTMAQTDSQTNSNQPVAASIAAVGANDVWMVGDRSNFGTGLTLTEHWDGTKWSIVPSPYDHLPNTPNSITSGELNTVTARGPNEVWAGGFFFTFTDGDPAGVYHALLLRWNGTSWTQDTAPTTGDYNVIQGISASPHAIWATNAGTPSLLTHP
ncbi:hypothetical protein J4573_52620 [Actinomadura barringtoniae]|uniref:Uncharacterized protein n=1 Tax=Actinomadura barringtoniae TaxID=1427535 RepID=A0A939PT74_9ACTN|nr:hypothetical protein [Actinomadura barringtoniae]MBO2455804.1 hypothetical protein [Actinomadura barringtoniae]